MRFGGDRPYSPDEEVPVIVRAFEIMGDGTEVPIGEPKARTISRGALDLMHGNEPSRVDALQARRQSAREAYYDNGGAPDARGEWTPVEIAIETATRVRVDQQLIARVFPSIEGTIGLRDAEQLITAAFRAAGFEVEE